MSEQSPNLEHITYEIQRAQGELDEFFSSDVWSPIEVAHIVRTYVPAEQARPIFDWLEKIMLGVDASAEAQEVKRSNGLSIPSVSGGSGKRAPSGMCKACGRPDPIDDYIPLGLGDRGVRGALEKVINQGVADKIAELDPMSKAAAMTTGTYSKTPALDFEDYSDNFFIKPFDKPGTFCMIAGPVNSSVKAGGRRKFEGDSVGVGKTATGFTFMEKFLRAKRYKVAVNTEVEAGGMPEGMFFCDSLRDLLIQSTINFSKGFLTVAFIDEFTQQISKEYGTANTWVNFKKFLYVSRRPGLILWTASQREVEIPTAIHDMATGHVQKKSQTMMRYRRGNETVLVKNIPMTSIPYKTEYSSFEFDDLDISDMHQFLRDHRGEENQQTLLLEYLRADKAIISKLDMKRCIQVLFVLAKNNDYRMTQEYAEEMTGIPRSTIRNWVNESKDLSLAKV